MTLEYSLRPEAPKEFYSFSLQNLIINKFGVNPNLHTYLDITQ